ncbi:MAG: hypothetical protein L0Y39_11955 [Methylococcaceae bacterium]|nr:hypothetical protein [Methylococcaceae bacterium]
MQFLEYRIPIIEREQIAAPNYSIPLDSEDPLFQEPLVRIEPLNIAFESYHAISHGDNPPYHRRIEGSRKDGWLRKTVAEKLVAVNVRLRPFGAELFILDAYRSMQCQRGLWNFFYQRARTEIENPTDEACARYALGYVRDPRKFDRADSRTFPAHATGASVDVTLRDIASGGLLNMGSEFEEIIDVSYNDYFERRLAEGVISQNDPRLQNRRLMHWAFSEEGFMNDPILFWHYDWGNQPFIKVKKALFPDAPKAAWYGYIDPPDWETEDAGLLMPEES